MRASEPVQTSNELSVGVGVSFAPARGKVVVKAFKCGDDLCSGAIGFKANPSTCSVGVLGFPQGEDPEKAIDACPECFRVWETLIHGHGEGIV